ncbi:MAG TPA: Dam family site-specific DNA-(adenine-N6)-methyltransferase [Burkholderiales bacterium]|nr:Dam family site-specific DNA-(adenine-N6)-methyltransferase [Burkholderiales bacterium]
MASSIRLKPFLKWAGGKMRLIEQIRNTLPPGTRLIEPFAGSSAVFLNTLYPTYLIADINKDLIQLYQHIQQEGMGFIDFAQDFFQPEYNNPATYNHLRNEFNSTSDPRRKSAIFIWLNRHGYNGLCRYNASGRFNVPFGRYNNPKFPLAEILVFHQRAQSARFLCDDFRNIMNQASPGDVVYCDPPYIPLTQTANFTSYSSSRFGLAEQKELAEMARKLARNGIPVIISNHSTTLIQTIYAGAQTHHFDVQRNISCNGKNREKASELLAVFT